VATQHAELAELATIPNHRRRIEAFADHVQDSVALPLQRLEKGLSLLKLEPTRSLLLTTAFAPPALAGLAIRDPAVGCVLGAAAAMGGAWWQVGNMRAGAKAGSPVGYLLDVRDRLTPRTIGSRVRKVLLGTYSRRGTAASAGATRIRRK
jgi:hypothetical protein